MATCEVCGNDYESALEVRTEGTVHIFDSFECAIHMLAPTCDHCGVRIVGHGVQTDESIFCCAPCAMAEGVVGIRDHV